MIAADVAGADVVEVLAARGSARAKSSMLRVPSTLTRMPSVARHAQVVDRGEVPDLGDVVRGDVDRRTVMSPSTRRIAIANGLGFARSRASAANFGCTRQSAFASGARRRSRGSSSDAEEAGVAGEEEGGHGRHLPQRHREHRGLLCVLCVSVVKKVFVVLIARRDHHRLPLPSGERLAESVPNLRQRPRRARIRRLHPRLRVCVVAFIPASILTLGAGAIFGFVGGTIVVVIGATLGATLAFLLARTVMRNRVEEMTASNAKFRALDRAIASEGMKIVFLVRLAVVFPVHLGQLRVRPDRHPALALRPRHVLRHHPGTAAFVFASSAGDEGRDRRNQLDHEIVYIAGGVVAIIVSVFIGRIATQAIRRAGVDEQ